MAKIPKVIKIISLLGMLPFLFGILATFKLSIIKPEFNTFLLHFSVSYAALILSFLGGCLFGFECLNRANQRSLRPWMAILPTLWALMALEVTNFSASILAIGFLLIYEFDRKFSASGLVPDWWLSLRFPLTAYVTLSLLIIGFYHGD